MNSEINNSSAMRTVCIVLLTVAAVLGDDGCMPGESCIPYNQCSALQQGGIVFSCGRTGGYICCPPRQDKPTHHSSTTRKPKTTSRPNVINPELNKRLLPIDSCGDANQPRIINGKEADLGQFPWMALLGFRSNKTLGKIDFLCGGTLINYRYVLTAAHCVANNKVGLPVMVRLGELDLTQDPDCTDEYCADPFVDVEIEKVIPHKNYNTPYLKNDIALLRLKKNITKTTYIYPICLPFGLNITGNEEKKYTAAGWGKTEYNNINGSDILMYAQITSSPIADCSEAQVVEVKPIDHTQLCAGGIGGYDACRGDSGGPLMDFLPDSEGNTKSFQMGIVSFGTIPCGAEGIPSVYTRVSTYITWILSNLRP